MDCHCTKPHPCSGTATHYVYSTLDSYRSQIGTEEIQITSPNGAPFWTWKTNAQGQAVDAQGNIYYENSGRQPLKIPVMLTPVFCQAGAEVVCAQRNSY